MAGLKLKIKYIVYLANCLLANYYLFGKGSEYEVSEDDGRYGADGELFGKCSEYDVWEVDGRIEIGEVFGDGTEYD